MKTLSKKLFTSVLTSSIALIAPISSLAEEVSTVTSDLGFFVAEDPSMTNNGGDMTSNLYKLASDGSVELLQRDIFPDVAVNAFQSGHYAVDAAKGKIYFLEADRGEGYDNRRYRIYDVKSNTFDGYVEVTGLPTGAAPINMGIPLKINDTIEKKCESSDSDCDDESDTKFVSFLLHG